MNIKRIKRKFIRNADLITTGFALVGLTTTIILAIKESREGFAIYDDACDMIEAIRHEVDEKGWPKDAEVESIREVQNECIKKLAINYAPTIVSFVTTGACIIGSNRISRNQNAALSGSLNAANLVFQEYRDHVRKQIGEKKETEIHDTIRKEHIDQKPMPVQNIINTGRGDTLCHLELEPGIKESGIYFLSSPESVHAALNDANGEGLSTGYVSLADFLYFLNIKVTYGGTTMRGWRIQSRSDFITLRESSHIYHDGRPVLDIEFWNPPYYDYDRFG